MSNAAANTVHSDLDEASTQYLTFFLGGEQYGVEILKVQGVQGWQRVTEIPNMPSFLLGVMNLRGDVVPVVDLRLRFGLAQADFSERTVVIIVRVECHDHPRTMGLVVDAVSEVHNVRTSEYRKSPEVGSGVSAEFLKGLGMVGEEVIILLDVDRLIGSGVLAQISPDAREAVN